MNAPRGPSGSIYSAVAPSWEPRPRAAAYLVGLGSLFVLLEAVLFAELLNAVVGLVLFATSFLIFFEPHHHRANGILALLLSVLTLFFGLGGFYLGALFAAVGGILAIVWSPPRSPVLSAKPPPAPPARS